MDMAALRDSPTIDMLAMKGTLVVLGAKSLVTPPGINEKNLRLVEEYTHTYATLERLAKESHDDANAWEYGALKRQYDLEAKRIMAALYK